LIPSYTNLICENHYFDQEKSDDKYGKKGKIAENLAGNKGSETQHR